MVEVFLELVPVTSSDIVYDIGSGDGRLLFTALEKGTGRAVGIELNPEMVRVANELAISKGLKNKVTFIEADALKVKMSDATVVLSYLDYKAAAALKQKLESTLKPGTRVVIEFSPIPGWKPVEIITKQYMMMLQYINFYFYVMPPKQAY